MWALKPQPKEVLKNLKESDIFCFPSTSSEGFPKAVLEALSCGIPVLSSSVSVLPYLLDGGGGLILEPPYQQSLVTQINNLIENTELYSSLSKQARNNAENYSIENWQEIIKDKVEDAWGHPIQKCKN